MYNSAYIDSEQRHRHQVIDKIISDSHEALAVPEIAHRLGDRAVRLSQIIDHLTIPNIRHDIIEPVHQHADLVEVIAIRPDQQVYRRYPYTSFNGIQERQIHLREPEIADEIIGMQSSYFSDYDDLSPVGSFNDLGSGVTAFVASDTLPLANAEQVFHLRGRPVVVFNLANQAESHPAFSLHEFTHVDHYHRLPLVNSFLQLQTVYYEDELEGYHVTAEVIRGQHESNSTLARLGGTASSRLVHIDELRIKHQKDSKRPFRANRTLIKKLDQAGYTIVVGDKRTKR